MAVSKVKELSNFNLLYLALEFFSYNINQGTCPGPLTYSER